MANISKFEKYQLTEWGKFYKKGIQIGGVKLSTQISHVKYYPKNYLTYLTLIQTQNSHVK